LHIEVRREIVVDAPPGEVWEALTDPEELAEWFAKDVELDVRPGGEGVFRWHDGSERRVVVEEVDAERLFSFWWWRDDGEASRVAISIDPVPDGTRVVVTETPPAEWATAIQMRFALRDCDSLLLTHA
jgi:uncharacterized protein YndB with AHSA1/START domain